MKSFSRSAPTRGALSAVAVIPSLRAAIAPAALLALLALSSPAHATPTVQILNSVATGPTPGLQAPTSMVAYGASTAVTYDSDPTLPWLIDVKGQFRAGTATMSRIGDVGFTPTTELSLAWFGGTDAHPYSAFVGANDGYVYRVDSITGACVWKTYIGRTTATTINFPGCTGGVPPAQIQCPNELGGTVTWASYYGPDGTAADTTVFVPTAYDEVSSGDDPDDCGTTADNRFYALNAATGAPEWVFNVDPTSATPYAINDNPPYQVNGVVGDIAEDLWSDGCSASSVSHTQLIFGTIDPGTGQDTLFSLSTVPGSAGTLNWSMAAGDIQSGLIQSYGLAASCGHLYATTASGGLFETIGLSASACVGKTVPCFVSPPQQLFVFGPQIGDTYTFGQHSSPLYGKIVVADSTTIHVLVDNGASTSVYCTASTLQSKFPTLTSGPSPLTNSIWVGANDASGNAAIVGLEVPAAAPPAPYDCGSAITSSPQPGNVGDIFFDFDPSTNYQTAVLYTAVNTPSGGQAVTATFTE